MPLLQVKDCPEETYEKLRECAKQEHRSISQQTVYIVERYLSSRATPALDAPSSSTFINASQINRYSRNFDDTTDYRERRMKTIERIRKHPPIPVSKNAPDTVELLRQVREKEAK